MKEKEIAKRDIILNAAIKVFAEKGYYSCRTLDISGEAGVAYGSLYQYFKSKEDILLSIFNENWDALLKSMEKLNRTVTDPFERLLSVFGFIFRSYQRNPNLMKVLIMDLPRLKQFYSPENWKNYNRFFTGVADIFQEGQKRGIFRKDFSPLIASFVIYGAVDMTIRQYVYNPDFNHEEFPVEKANNQIMGLLEQGFLMKEPARKGIKGK
ncbi:MAG: TetR/AcrR family transcriptional regulator [Deltaproteobacteria bacterium]|nr:TetR/AcrR family transcriptional regulator [Deltaproteobacteria bacterium]